MMHVHLTSLNSHQVVSIRPGTRCHDSIRPAKMTSPSTERRFAVTSKKPTVTRLRILVCLPLLYLVICGQLYIASTFTGTRPSRSIPAPPILPDAYSVWDECSSIISSGLTDVADAGRIWLRYAYVGSNSPTNNLPPDRPEDKYRCRCLTPQLHANGTPLVTAIVQSFNHHQNVHNISTSLKHATAVDEIIISEDGSTDGSLHDWHSVLRSDNHFIIRSNNLHELRSYNRAMRMATGKIVVLLQDDDRLPLKDDWVQNAIRLFDALPDLGVLGGYIGQTWQYPSGQGFEFGDQKSTHGGVRGGNTKMLPFIEPITKVPFTYSECTWIAPVFIRQSLLQKIGGLELTIAKRGEPGIWQDCIYSYEAWVNGFTVGTYFAPFERGVGGHGSATSSMKLKQRERVYERAVAYANRKFSRRRVHDNVQSLNNRTLIPRPR